MIAGFEECFGESLMIWMVMMYVKWRMATNSVLACMCQKEKRSRAQIDALL